MLKKKRKKNKTKVAKSKRVISIEPDKYFWVCDGQVLKNLEQLNKSLEKMSNEVFGYHVNEMKNDFAKWVEDVWGDKKLALDLKRAKSAQTAAQKVKARIK